MANKKVSQLTSKPSVLVTDLFPIADPTTGQLFKTTISALGTAIGSGVSSVNTLVGAVVLDTDDIQELASPTNKWFTDTRARAALSASSPLVYNSGTGAFSIPAATTSVNGYLTSTDWNTFNAKQVALSGTGFVKISGTTISYDNSTYLTTSAAASTYLALAGGTLTGALNGTSANFSGDLTLTGTNPRFYLTDSDNNPDYFISNTDGTFTVYDVTNSTARFTIGTTGNGIFGGSFTVGSVIKSGGTSSQFLKADGSVDSSVYALDSAVVHNTGNETIGGQKTFSTSLYGTSGLFSGTVSANYVSISAATGGNGIYLTHNSTFNSIVVTQSGSGSAIYATGNVTVIGTAYISGQLQLGSATFLTNLTQTITLPTSSGTLALTSQLSTYLPLSGGTLTGALSGTSATFSTQLKVSNSSGSALDLIVLETGWNNPSGNKSIIWKDATNTLGRISVSYDASTGSTMRFGSLYNGGYQSSDLLTIASTGAATFSSSVQTTNIGINFAPQTDRLFVYNGSGTNVLITAQQDGTGDLIRLNGNSGANRFVVQQGGNVGIGTTSPAKTLTVVNTAEQLRLSYDGSSIYSDFRNDSAGGLLINTTGGYIINYITGSAKTRINANGDFIVYSLGTGLVYSNGGALTSTNPSDSRLKTDIKSIEYGLNDILKLRPVSYNWKDDKVNQGIQFGFIAQEVQEIMPNAIKEFGDKTKFLGLEKDAIYATLVNAIKELNSKIEILENK